MNLKAIIETILFVHGEPIGIEKLSVISKSSEKEVEAALGEFRDDYKERGLVLLEKDGEYQLGSNPANASYIADLVKSEFSEELSRAGLETIAIVAYKGPLTRAEIEYVRGVNSSFTLRNLLIRGLVERIENPKDARSYLYKISFDFLKHMGVTSPVDLPGYAEFKQQKIEIFDGAGN